MSVKNNLIDVCRFCERHQAVVLKMTSPEAMDCKAKLEMLKDELSGCFPRDWDIKYSSGNGNFPKVPYISFLPPGQKTSNGLYVVICFGKTGNGLVAGCTVSQTNKKANSFLSSVQTVNRGPHPVIDVNGTMQTAKYNNCFVNPLEVLVDSIDEDVLVSHLRQSASECIRMLGRNSSPEPPPETPINATPQSSFSIGALNDFKVLIAEGGLIYSSQFVDRFVAALCAKPFVVLSGLSGSGKTKLAQAFTCWIKTGDTVEIAPVGADWTNSEKLLGYPNALDKDLYVMPDTRVLKLLMDAEKNDKLPFFLILDEMNLSHVERYFADFLSAMESGDEIKLYDGDQRYADKAKTISVPRRIRVPKNLFVIGTMNVDETTYMFSPKVLDRAQVIEFRVKPDEMAKFVGYDDNGTWKDGLATKIDLDKLADPNGIGKGAKYAESFLELALKRGEKKPSNGAINDVNSTDNGKVPLQEVAKALNAFFEPLAELGAEFGYRSASEILSFCGFYLDAGAKIDEAIDAAVVQKLLPKLHGSRRRLEGVFFALWKECLDAAHKTADLDKTIEGAPAMPVDASTCRYPLSAEKIFRMRKASLHNGFASFAEA